MMGKGGGGGQTYRHRFHEVRGHAARALRENGDDIYNQDSQIYKLMEILY